MTADEKLEFAEACKLPSKQMNDLDARVRQLEAGLSAVLRHFSVVVQRVPERYEVVPVPRGPTVGKVPRPGETLTITPPACAAMGGERNAET